MLQIAPVDEHKKNTKKNLLCSGESTKQKKTKTRRNEAGQTERLFSWYTVSSSSELEEKAAPTFRSLRRSEWPSDEGSVEVGDVEHTGPGAAPTVQKQSLVQVEDLFHELIGGKSHGLGGDTADVVERKASVQSFLDPKRIINIFQRLDQWPVKVKTKKCNKITHFLEEKKKQSDHLIS